MPITTTREVPSEGIYQIRVTGSLNQLHRASNAAGVAMRAWAADIKAGPVRRIHSQCIAIQQSDAFTYTVTYRLQEPQ